jgi:benzil reductase ((S)-benzoin forming)
MNQQHLFIVTGASRGMGLAMAQQLLQPGQQLLCISRRANEALAAQAQQAGVSLMQWTLDLAQAQAAAARLEQWLGTLDATGFASATLINNAALVTPPGPLQGVEPQTLADVLRVGLEAPMQLTAAFARATAGWAARRRVLNISSGLGRRAMAGAAPYCAVKAGLDHFSRSMALDEARAANGVAIVSLAPGVIDTDMQTVLRSSDPQAFPDGQMFRQLHSTGQLSTPADAAARVLAYLQRPDFGSNPVADVRDA